ncbi:MAG: hypothetical protein HYU99_08790, partial [Deltaproteobacteria bacterium]|nr:hypothetical protein [Deltaproteobacteria bacterium]
GLIGGAISGGITGGVKGAMFGALFGGLGGALFGGVGKVLSDAVGKIGSMAILGTVGVGLSYATGGWKGLVTFGAGILGGLAGYKLAGAMRMNQMADTRSSFSGQKLYAQNATPYDGEDGNLRAQTGMVGGGRSRGEYYRYVGGKEAQYIQETGRIPNTTAEGQLKNVYYTNENFNSSIDAQQRLALPSEPTHRITIDANNVRANYGSTVSPAYGQPGGGAQFITHQPIPVDPLKIDTLK